TSRPRRPSASRSRRRCWGGGIRLSNDGPRGSTPPSDRDTTREDKPGRGVMSGGEKGIRGVRIGVGIGVRWGGVWLWAGLTAHAWKLGVGGWFMGGALLTMVAMFTLLDGAIAARKAQMQK